MFTTQKLGDVFEFHYVLLLVTVFLSFKYIWKRFRVDSRLTTLASEIPGPKFALPILGHTLNFIFAGQYGQITLQEKWMKKYGSIFRVWIGNNLMVALNDTQHLESSKVLKRSRLMNPLTDFLSGGLITDKVPQWRTNRKRLQPYFTSEVVRSYVPIINEENQKFVTILKKLADGTEHDIRELFNFLSVKMTLKMVCDHEVDWADRFEAVAPINDTEKMLILISAQLFLPILKMGIIGHCYNKFLLQPYKKKFVALIKQCFENYQNLTLSLGEEEKKSNPICNSSFLIGSSELLNQNNGEEKMFNELCGIFIAAFNGIAITNTLTLLMIAMNPDVQKKLHDEIDKILDDDRLPDLTDVDRLTYLDQVIKETERRFTVSPMLLRETEEPINIGKYYLPAGTGIIINVAMVHLNPSIYPEPYKFNPDNFNPDKVRARSRFSFLPFSAGPRNCIGKKFAEIEMKFTMAILLREFEFHTSMKMDDIKFFSSKVVYNEAGFLVSFRSRRGK